MIEDLPRMALLVVLYAFQGLPIGLFVSTVPILFKKYMSYQEVGVIMMCTLPFSLKVLWSPLVDIYYSRTFGRRKSWIIPTQVAMSVILLYLSGQIENMLEQRQVYTLTCLFTLMMFVVTCQDIAVDSWAIEILYPEHSSYGSSCQSVGHTIGFFISTSMFIALHSLDFCNTYLFSEVRDQPLLSLSAFMLIWSQFQLAVTAYIAVFVPETHHSSEGKEEEEHYGVRQVLIILKDILKNKHLQVYFLFKVAIMSTLVINSNLGQVYLTNDLKFPAEKLSLIQVALAPLEIVCSLLSGYMSSSSPFKFSFYVHIVCSIISTYTILVLFGFFPTDRAQVESFTTVAHVIILALISTVASTCLDTGAFAVYLQICDKRVAGVQTIQQNKFEVIDHYITLLATINNMSSYIHKLYMFTAIEYFGLYWPQVFVSVIALTLAFILRRQITEMDKLPKDVWQISDSILTKVKQH